MYKAKRHVNSFTVTHPNDADIKVHFKRFNRLEVYDFAWELGTNPQLNPKNVSGLFAKAVTRIEGFVDEESGSAIQWTGDPAIFFEEDLPEISADDRKTPFWQWLLEQIQVLALSAPKQNG